MPPPLVSKLRTGLGSKLSISTLHVQKIYVYSEDRYAVSLQPSKSEAVYLTVEQSEKAFCRPLVLSSCRCHYVYNVF